MVPCPAIELTEVRLPDGSYRKLKTAICVVQKDHGVWKADRYGLWSGEPNLATALRGMAGQLEFVFREYAFGQPPTTPATMAFREKLLADLEQVP